MVATELLRVPPEAVVVGELAADHGTDGEDDALELSEFERESVGLDSKEGMEGFLHVVLERVPLRDGC